LETIVGFLCFNLRGRDITNIIILTFVGAILWYRWAFYFTGGRSCGCLGLLGHLLHLNKTQEKFIPLMALLFFVLSTFPWLFRIIKNRLILLARITPCFFLLFDFQKIYGSNFVEVHGEIDAADYNPITGKVYTNSPSRAIFVAVISGDAWKLCVTNIDNTAWWSVVAYDGTNTYVERPFGGNYKQGIMPRIDLNQARIRPSASFLPIEGDSLGITIGWLAYGLSPQAIKAKTINNDIVEIPLPWEVRSMSFGYKWNFKFLPSERYVSNCTAIRDQSLDLNEDEELMRPELRYPDSIQARQEYVTGFSFRHNRPTGFVAARYECTEWHDYGNGNSVPTASDIQVFDSPRYSYPFQKISLKADKVVVRQGAVSVLPEIKTLTEVDDWRCRRVGKSRILPSAEYTLQPGDLWKSDNDPFLETVASSQFEKNGIQYNKMTTKKNIFAWLLLALLCAPAVVLLWKTTKTKTKNQ